jgi:TonB-linked SusC/RagA family outer membrane protein
MTYRDTIIKSLSSLILLLFLFSTAHAQQAVQGTVTSADDGNPLPGVNISVQGASAGTASAADGTYSISVPEGSNVLVFSFIGFSQQQITIDGQSEINVSMEPTASELEELVVVGYGTQRKSDLTGSISTVDVDDVQKIPTSSLQDALQGKVAGVQVTPNSGQPGSQPTVRIRGVGTLNNANPLYVVDGLLTNDIQYLSPQNVESVQVLKDASATAIYGSRGANGVIVITTKQGESGTTQISGSSYFGYQQVGNTIDLANASEFATLANESAANEGREAVFENPGQFGAGTDYQDLIFESAPIQNYQITASGGSDNHVYSLSGTYFKQDGIITGSNFQRATLRLNNEYFLSDFVSVGHNIAFSYDDNVRAAGGIVNTALQADPTLPPRNENGEFTNTSQNGGAGNPAASIFYNENDNFGFRTAGNAYLNVEFLKNLNFNSSFSLDLRRDQGKTFVPVFFVSPIQSSDQNSLNVVNNNTTDWIIKNTLEYQEEWDDHRLKVLGGITAQKSTSEGLGGRRVNFPGTDPSFFFLNAGESDGQTNFNGSSSSGIISYLGRVNYVFKDRYLFTGTYRVDGSSKFGANNRYGYFPSVALGWRISEEPFFNVPEISNLKLRGSWGRVGNDKIDSNAAIPTVNSGLTAVFGEEQLLQPGATITALANSNLKWEETEQLDIGLEMGLFEDRLSAEVDYYNKETNDILVTVPIPGAVGAGAPVVNAASVLNRGFELSINWQQNRGDFTYSVGLVGSTIHNEVLELGENQEAIFSGSSRNLGNTTRTDVGDPIGAFYGFEEIGVFQDQQEIDNNPSRGGAVPGDLRIADINGDGEITDADRKVLGSPIPDYTLGLNLSSSYKNIDLSVAFDGQFGNEVLNARRASRGFRLLNYEAAFLDRWTGPGTSNDEPRITESGANYVTDRFLQSGDFIRLRNVQIGYSLPASLVESLTVRGIRIYANASNLFTSTDYTGYNPQVSNSNVLASGIDDGVFPIASSYTFGIELNF